MSKCISREGEYSDHTLGENVERFTCTRCFVFDEDAAMVELARKDKALADIAALHLPRRVYEECDCGHSDEAVLAGDAVDTGDFIACEETYIYSICQACCTDLVGEQTEDCASEHKHDKDEPICFTARILASLAEPKDSNDDTSAL